ncbi:MAG: hypothetical protein P0S94_00260, partial [Simkaniaceae bacterium]|nr:hypothetical protein [Simkaniaceae bacterium]
MTKKSKFDFYLELKKIFDLGNMSERDEKPSRAFYESYKSAIEKKGETIDQYDDLFSRFLQMIAIQFETPFLFEPYHERVLEPLNYY